MKNKIYSIYKATNIINNKVYIGFTSNLIKRIKSHKKGSENYSGNGTKSAFYEAIIKYGWENFLWDILYQSKNLNHTKNEMETIFILEHNSFCGFKDSNGYNLTLGGDGSLGRICDQKTREKIKVSLDKHYEDENNRNRQRQYAINWWKNLSEEEKKLHKEKSKIEIPWNKGKKDTFKHSEETKKKMSIARKGIITYERTPESIEKQKQNRKGKGCGENNGMSKEEHRKKVSLSKIGRKKYINPNTLVKKYCFPGTEPAGYIISKKQPKDHIKCL